MFDKISRIGFSVLFICMLVIPLLTTNLQQDKLSKSENRKLAPMAELYKEDGTLNGKFASDLETWINDNIGLRDWFVVNNANMQFYVFDVLANNSDSFLGPEGELNYATKSMLVDYQHLNLRTTKELEEIAESFQICAEYLEQKGIPFYYFQCWDKHSIYPEYFPDTVLQYGSVSKTDQLVEILKEKTDIVVISPKNELINAKLQYDTYSEWGDATHWTQRGAFIGYNILMSEINQKSNRKYKVLTEEDYQIDITDQGSTLFGGIHKEDYIEKFSINNPKAYLTEEAPAWLSQWQSRSRTIYQNDCIDNEDVLLVLGDSYFDSYLYDDFAESFHKVVFIWGDYFGELVDIVDYYQPTIVVAENAERCDRTKLVILAAEKIQDMYGY